MSDSQAKFEQVLIDNQDKIYRICRIYAAPPLEPQDLFQEVIFQIWKSLPSFAAKSSIDTWVYRIALNVSLRSKMKLEKSNTQTTTFEAISIKHLEAEDSSLEEEKFRFLKECIAQLNASDTSLIVLYLDELSYKQIAEITGLSENNIAVKMKRIRQRLFDCIAPKIQ
tara:strand:- start:4136 stop:4639 length:504 start_codon:yes stop_codon:yes gene_type:complete